MQQHTGEKLELRVWNGKISTRSPNRRESRQIYALERLGGPRRGNQPHVAASGLEDTSFLPFLPKGLPQEEARR